MCGIIGYIGEDNALPFLLEGLEKMEYRGYDSSGISVMSENKIKTYKKCGRLEALKNTLASENTLVSSIGIGHTRWATHGKPSDINSHPHVSQSGKISVVHNGIIENYISLKNFLVEKGYKFISDTDTEVVAQLIDFHYDGDLLKAVQKTVSDLEGSYALGIICSDEPDKIIAVKKDSPLIIGTNYGENKDKSENYIASDIMALLLRTRKIYRLQENNIAVIKKNSIVVYTPEEKILNPEKDFELANWDIESSGKGNYEHFMMKEIMEQPEVISKTLTSKIKNGEISFEHLNISDEYLKNISKIYIVACGSAANAGSVGRYIIEKLLKIPVEVELASEFRYKEPLVDKNTLVIVISQSGETADSLAALREAKKQGAKILSIVNVKGSSIANESDYVIYTSAGPEIAVATTKAYSCQLCIIYIFSLFLADKLNIMDSSDMSKYINKLASLSDKIQEILLKKEQIMEIAKKYKDNKYAFFIGRTLDYAVCMEGSLKLKEVSYIHSEAYAAGELKHGPISLIENGTLVIALLTQDKLFDKMVSNLREVKARGAKIFAVTTIDHKEKISQIADDIFYIPNSLSEFSPSLSVIPFQIFSYYSALLRNCDIDKPRNLAKSVTVE